MQIPLCQWAPRQALAMVAAFYGLSLSANDAVAQAAHHHERVVATAASTSIPVVRAIASTTPLRWSSAATWGGTLPSAGTHVIIPAGSSVLLDGATAALAGLTVEGLLDADPHADVAITSPFVLVTGELRIGTPLAPFERRATITLTGTTLTNPLLPTDLGNKALLVRGGTLSLHGRSRVTSGWTKLAADAAAGGTRLSLSSAPGWQPGDRIVIATSTPNQADHDVATIASITGSEVTLDAPLRFFHRGSMRTAAGVPIDMRAEVGLLSHNIVVQGDAASTTLGGHAMFMDGTREARIQIARAEFRRMGQLNQLGRYPIHFHLMGSTSDTYLRDIAVHSTMQRGVVLHSTRNVTMSGSVVFNTVGHNVVIEDGQTTDNVLDRNLALVNRQPSPLPTNPTLRAQNDRLPANFWLKAARNTLTRNAAAGSFDSGIIFDFVEPGTGTFDLRHNVAHAAMAREGAGAGDFDIMAGILVADGEPRPSGDVIRGNLVYHNAVGFWPEEAGEFVIDSLIAVENEQQTFQRDAFNRVRYRDPLFVGQLTSATYAARVNLMLQYGSHVVLERPHFVNTNGMGLAQVVDADNGAGVLRVEGLRLTNSRLEIGIGDDNMIVSLDNDVLAPRGVYLFNDFNATPACARTELQSLGGEAEPYFRCPRLYRYTQLDVRDRAAPSVRQHTRQAIRRSDGLLVSNGQHGYFAVADANLGYAMTRASSSGYAFRLHVDPPESGGAPIEIGEIRTTVPVAQRPLGVWRSGWGTNPPSAPAATTALRAATSLADFEANPRTTFWYDASARTVTAAATARWLVISAPAPLTAARLTCDAATPSAQRAAAALLAFATDAAAGRTPASLTRALADATSSCR